MFTRVEMSLPPGLPPLPKSLSDAAEARDAAEAFKLQAATISASQLEQQSTGGSNHSQRQGSLSSTQDSTSDRDSVHSRASSSLSAHDQPTSTATLDTQLAILRREMYSLRQLDLTLLSQLWALNESIQGFRTFLQEREEMSPSPTPSNTNSISSEEPDDESAFSPLPQQAPPLPPMAVAAAGSASSASQASSSTSASNSNSLSAALSALNMGSVPLPPTPHSSSGGSRQRSIARTHSQQSVDRARAQSQQSVERAHAQSQQGVERAHSHRQSQSVRAHSQPGGNWVQALPVSRQKVIDAANSSGNSSRVHPQLPPILQQRMRRPPPPPPPTRGKSPVNRAQEQRRAV